MAETQVINGVQYECKDGLCRPVEAISAAGGGAPALPTATRVAQGYMGPDEFLAFLRGEPATPTLPKSAGLLVLALLLAGLAMNLTPCVLPMIPVNLAVIGRSASRGALYGLGLALAYGTLGVLASLGGLAFGTIQASPLFNGFVALVFVALGLALCGVVPLDLARGRTSSVVASLRRLGALFPFFMGVLGAVLAGACVAPVLVSTLVLTADLSAQGNRLAWALPFVLGLGMALPWPFLGAGLKVLPAPGAWMRWVSRAFALAVFAFAAWYAGLAIKGAKDGKDASVINADLASLESLLSSSRSSRPVLVDCWATWCKNCAAMEHGTLRDSRVVEALRNFTVVRLQAEDLAELTRRPGFGEIRGLPAFVIFDCSPVSPRP